MSISEDQLNEFKKKIKEKEQLLYLTVTDPDTKKKINFSVKNNSTFWRGKTLFTKEPITIQWIKSFKKNNIFFDIGANIGVYSLYAGINSNVKVYSFEPESNSFQTLMENIIINNQEKKILAYPIGISNKTELTKLHLSEFATASSHHTVGKKALDHNSLKQISTRYKQGVFSTTLNELIKKWDLPIPNYIKIDVDGIEYKIIEQGEKIFQNKKLLSILIEINEDRDKDKEIINILKSFGFIYDVNQVEKTKRKDGPHKNYVEYLFYR